MSCPEPILSEFSKPLFSERNKPYDIDYYFYIGFFGGVLPLSIIAFRNNDSLHVHSKTRIKTVVATLFFLAIIPVTHSLSISLLGDENSRLTYRLLNKVTGILYSVFLIRELKPYTTVFEMFYPKISYSSLFGIGVSAVLILGTVQNLCFKIFLGIN